MQPSDLYESLNRKRVNESMNFGARSSSNSQHSLLLLDFGLFLFLSTLQGCNSYCGTKSPLKGKIY